MRLAVSVADLRKDYVLSGETVHALRGVSFDVPEGDYISIMGPSRLRQEHAAQRAWLPRSADRRAVSC